jgi:acyl-CoA thioester hydrolase
VGEVFECEIQARLRDVNLGGHVDNVEALRVLDEARLLFLRYAPLAGSTDDQARGGLYRDLPATVTDLVGSQRVDYHSEMRFAPYQPFRVRIWVSHVGRTSFSVSYQMVTAPGHPPAISAESTLVLWDTAAGTSWQISDEVRALMEAYTGEPVALRERPGR